MEEGRRFVNIASSAALILVRKFYYTIEIVIEIGYNADKTDAKFRSAHIALLSQGSVLEYGKPAEICRKYNHLNRLRVTLRDGRTLTLENGRASASRIREYLENDAIEAIHSTEPTLETVFIELTGRGLDEHE